MLSLFESNRPYIKEDKVALVKTHKYQGEELSYSYNYFYSPICTWIADRLPMWLAPNVVSMAGFMCNLIPHLMVPLLFTYDMEGDLPGWFCVMMGVAFFLYMLCDNTDGKQARRTGSSSPLGMLIDHGMDSISAAINNILIQTMVQAGNGNICIISMVSTTLPFYYAVLEQYYTGELILQAINGIDEGSFVYIFMCFIAAYYGAQNLFNTPITVFGHDTKYGHLLGYIMFVAAFLQIIPNLRNIYEKRHSERFKKLYKNEYFISHMAWYIINAAIFITAAVLSPQDVLSTHPRRVQYAFSFQFILITLRVQFSGVTLDIFSPFRRTTLLAWSVLLSQIFFSLFYKKSLMDEATMYLILASITFVSIVHLVYYLFEEFKQILDINILTLTQKQLDAQKITKKIQ